MSMDGSRQSTDDNRQDASGSKQPAGGSGIKELFKLFLIFLEIGTFTIGGGFAMIPLLERIAITKKKWMSEEEMAECVAISQTMPGVIAVNMATYVGNKRMGFPGALASTVGVILPSFIIIMVVAHILGYISDNPYLEGALMGVKAGLCGLIVATTYRMAKRNLRSIFGWIMAVASFISIAFLGINGFYVVIAAGVLGIVYYLISRKQTREEGFASEDMEYKGKGGK